MSDSPSTDATIPPVGQLTDPDATLTEAQLLVNSGTLSQNALTALIRTDQRKRWLRGDRLRTESYLATFPSLRNNEQAILDLLFNEIVLQEELGEPLDLDDYARRFPKLAETLRQQYTLHRRLCDDSSATQVSGTPNRVVVSFHAERKTPTVEGYELLNELGRGGMGVVYKARQQTLNRLVALKMILGGAHASPEGLLRFRTEAEAVAALQHPNIVQIYEIGEQDGLPYFALEFVDGGTLANLIERGDPMSPRPAAQLVATLAEAMHAAHQRGIIHRDLKPDNVLMTRDGRPLITDFGLAKRLNDDRECTHDGSIMGTPAYMAPEQAAGNIRAVGILVDVYALGAILYELLTRRPPFDSDSPLETLRQVIDKDPLPPSRLNPRVDRDLETICLKCLAKDPHKRYASALLLAIDLHHYLNHEPILARPTGLFERLGKWMRRHPARATLIVGAHLTLLAAVVGAVSYHLHLQWAYNQTETALAEAQLQHEEAAKAKRRVEIDLIDMTVRNGLQRVDNGDLLSSLPWLVRALQLEMQRKNPDPNYERMHRIRIGSVLRQCPRMLHFLSHHSRVTWAAWSPDGRLILTTTADGNAHLWDAATGSHLREPVHHSDVLRYAAFSEDGKRIVTASADKTARIWDSTSDKVLILQHQGEVNFAAFSPDGKSVVTASSDHTAQIWDAATGERVGPALRHKESVHRAVFSPDGTLVATASNDHTGRLWDAATGAGLEPIFEHKDAVNDIAFSVNGRLVATASADGTANVYSVRARTRLLTLSHSAPVLFVAFAGDGRHIVTAGDDNAAHVWNVVTGERIGAPLKHSSRVLSAAFRRDPDSKQLEIATASDDNTARVWEAQTGASISPPLTHNGTVIRAVFHPTLPQLLTACTDGTARVWITSVTRTRDVSLEHHAPVKAASFSPDGRLVLTATTQGHADLWDAASGQKLARWQADKQEGEVHAAVFSPDGRYVATAGADKAARLWDVVSRAQIGPDLPHDGAVQALAFSADSRLIVTGSSDHKARLWEVPSGRKLAEFVGHEGAIHSVAFRPDGRRMATASHDHTARIWDTADAAFPPVVLRHREEVFQVSFSLDGGRLVTASADCTAQVWNAANGQPIGDRLRHADKVVAAEFDTGGARVVTGSHDNTARLWDSRTGAPLTPPMRHGGAVLWARFGPGGARVMTGSLDNTARVWNAASAEPLSPPLTHSAAVVAVGFGPEGDRIVTGSCDRTARIWDMPPAHASLGDLVMMAQMLSGCWIDSTGGLVSLPTPELDAIWLKVGPRISGSEPAKNP